MAFVATSFGVEKLPASLSGFADGVLIAGYEVIERRIEGKLGALVGCDSTDQIGSVWCAAEDFAERLLVFGHGRDGSHCSVEVGLAHLTRIDDGKSRLIFESFRPAVPELRLVIERIQNRRRVALAGAAFNSDGHGSSVGESERGVMAGTAGDRPVNRQASVEEKFFAKSSFFWGLWIVRWRRCPRRLDWHADLAERLWGC